jgi:hypothetical protein
MGSQIIKQPDGKYAIFSSSSGQIEMWNATAEEIIEDFAEAAARSARRSAQDQIAKIDAGEKTHYQFTMTWEEAMESDREHGGDAWSVVGEKDGVEQLTPDKVVRMSNLDDAPLQYKPPAR